MASPPVDRMPGRNSCQEPRPRMYGGVAVPSSAVIISPGSAGTAEPSTRVIEAAMRSEQRQQPESGRVVTFRPRSSSPNRVSRNESKAESSTSAVADLQKYQRAREEEDYRHRMIVNVLALAFCILLAIAGVWLVNEIAEMKRVQDCILSGRAGCVPLGISLQRGP